MTRLGDHSSRQSYKGFSAVIDDYRVVDLVIIKSLDTALQSDITIDKIDLRCLAKDWGSGYGRRLMFQRS